MSNQILRKRIITAIAMSYAIPPEDVWRAYQKVENLETILNLLETNQLQTIIKEIAP